MKKENKINFGEQTHGWLATCKANVIISSYRFQKGENYLVVCPVETEDECIYELYDNTSEVSIAKIWNLDMIETLFNLKEIW